MVRLEAMREKGSKVIGITELPTEFDGEIESVEERVDKMKNVTFFLRIVVAGVPEPKPNIAVQKFTSTAIPELVDALEKLGYKDTDETKGQLFHWKKQKVGRAVFERWLPVAKVTKKK